MNYICLLLVFTIWIYKNSHRVKMVGWTASSKSLWITTTHKSHHTDQETHRSNTKSLHHHSGRWLQFWITGNWRQLKWSMRTTHPDHLNHRCPFIAIWNHNHKEAKGSTSTIKHSVSTEGNWCRTEEAVGKSVRHTVTQHCKAWGWISSMTVQDKNRVGLISLWLVYKTRSR